MTSTLVTIITTRIGNYNRVISRYNGPHTPSQIGLSVPGRDNGDSGNTAPPSETPPSSTGRPRTRHLKRGGLGGVCSGGHTFNRRQRPPGQHHRVLTNETPLRHLSGRHARFIAYTLLVVVSTALIFGGI